jgi:transposase
LHRVIRFAPSHRSAFQCRACVSSDRAEWLGFTVTEQHFTTVAGRLIASSIMMPTTPHAVWLVVESVDMRLGIDGLSLAVQQALGRSPCDGSVFVFRNRRGSRLKLLVWDGTGVWLCQRRLHSGSFVWPVSAAQTVALSAQQWQWLTTGVDWQRLSINTVPEWQI